MPKSQIETVAYKVLLLPLSMKYVNYTYMHPLRALNTSQLILS